MNEMRGVLPPRIALRARKGATELVRAAPSVLMALRAIEEEIAAERPAWVAVI